jgi:hypothetical protein
MEWLIATMNFCPCRPIRTGGRLATNRSTVARSVASNASHDVASYSAARRA